jgi:hypothetical protein
LHCEIKIKEHCGKELKKIRPLSLPLSLSPSSSLLLSPPPKISSPHPNADVSKNN